MPLCPAFGGPVYVDSLRSLDSGDPATWYFELSQGRAAVRKPSEDLSSVHRGQKLEEFKYTNPHLVNR